MLSSSRRFTLEIAWGAALDDRIALVRRRASTGLVDEGAFVHWHDGDLATDTPINFCTRDSSGAVADAATDANGQTAGPSMACKHGVVAGCRRNSTKCLADSLLADAESLFQRAPGAHLCSLYLGVVGDANTLVAMVV